MKPEKISKWITCILILSTVVVLSVAISKTEK